VDFTCWHTLKKFVEDPDQFITKLLGREMDNEADWPPMESHVLRGRLRQFLLDLHDEQEAAKRNKSNEASVIADSKPLRILLRKPVTKISTEQTASAVSKQKIPEPESSSHFKPPLEEIIQDRKPRVKKSPQQIMPTRSSPRLNRKELNLDSKPSDAVNDDSISPKSSDSLLIGIEEMLDNEPSTRKPSVYNDGSAVEIPGTPPPSDRGNTK